MAGIGTKLRGEVVSMAAKILIIDDAPDFVYALRTFLEGLGYEVVEAHDGETGLEVLEREKPDLVLLDVIMPHKNGWETLSDIRSKPEYADLPVVMLTALDEPHHLMEGYDRGCTDYFTKPIQDYDELALVIQRLLEVSKRMKQEKQEGVQRQ